MDSNSKAEEIVNKTLHTRLLLPTLRYIISPKKNYYKWTHHTKTTLNIIFTCLVNMQLV